MVIFTCGVVAARYIFNVGSIGIQELVMYLHGSVFMIGIAFTLKEKGHVRVDVLHEKFSEKNTTTKRPGTGISPMKWFQNIGRKSKFNFKPNDIIKF